jgi:hypothetical protein
MIPRERASVLLQKSRRADTLREKATTTRAARQYPVDASPTRSPRSRRRHRRHRRHRPRAGSQQRRGSVDQHAVHLVGHRHTGETSILLLLSLSTEPCQA